jgi:hypothetical protein
MAVSAAIAESASTDLFETFGILQRVQIATKVVTQSMLSTKIGVGGFMVDPINWYVLRLGQGDVTVRSIDLLHAFTIFQCSRKVYKKFLAIVREIVVGDRTEPLEVFQMKQIRQRGLYE